MTAIPIRTHLTVSQMRAVIEALIEEARKSGLPYGASVCRFGVPELEPVISERDLRLPVFPWQPHWGAASSFTGSELPADIWEAMRGLAVNVTQSWIVFTTKPTPAKPSVDPY